MKKINIIVFNIKKLVISNIIKIIIKKVVISKFIKEIVNKIFKKALVSLVFFNLKDK